MSPPELLRLDKINFVPWLYSLKEYLQEKDKLYVISQPLPDFPPDDDKDGRSQWWKHVNDSTNVSILMRRFIDLPMFKGVEVPLAYEMIQELKETFHKQLTDERNRLIGKMRHLRAEGCDDITSIFHTLNNLLADFEFFGFTLPHRIIVGYVTNALGKSFNDVIESAKVDLDSLSLSEIQYILEDLERHVPGLRVE